MQVGERFLRRAEAAGRLSEIVRGGWVIEDLGDGGLQFDNAECGVALLSYYELTGESGALASVRRAADWAMRRPLVANWNYNSFSIWLLAEAHRVTRDSNYLAAAVEKARYGLLPGQLLDGPRAGRWVDPHNARPAYHYIMLRSLASLWSVIPVDHPERGELKRALVLGLKAWNSEFVTRGIMNMDKALEALMLVNIRLACEPGLLEDTGSRAALDQLGKAVSAAARRGRPPVSPGEWGAFLEYVMRP
jgi:hypothetical protein